MASGAKQPFGPRLRVLREAAGLTQAQLAEGAGLHPQAVVKLERGEREPAWATVLALAEALGVDCLAFTGGDSREASAPRASVRPPKAAPAPPPAGDLEGQAAEPAGPLEGLGKRKGETASGSPSPPEAKRPPRKGRGKGK